MYGALAGFYVFSESGVLAGTDALAGTGGLTRTSRLTEPDGLDGLNGEGWMIASCELIDPKDLGTTG